MLILNVKDRIILKLIFKKWHWVEWTGLIWLRIGTGGGLSGAVTNFRVPLTSGEILDQLRTCQLLRKDSAPWNEWEPTARQLYRKILASLPNGRCNFYLYGQEIPFFYGTSGYITYLCKSIPAFLHLSQIFHLSISRITIMEHNMLCKAPCCVIFCNSAFLPLVFSTVLKCCNVLIFSWNKRTTIKQAL